MVELVEQREGSNLSLTRTGMAIALKNDVVPLAQVSDAFDGAHDFAKSVHSRGHCS